MEALKKEQKEVLQSVLTADQKALLEKKKADTKGRFEEMDKRRAEHFKTRLGLTDEQAIQMKKNREDLQAKIRSIREDKSLSEENKKEAIRKELKAQKQKTNSLLTEEQKKKIREMHPKKGDHKEVEPADKKKV